MRDVLLATLTSVIWGLGFVVAKFGLESFSAMQMTALRFLIVSIFVFVVPRPRLPMSSLVAIGATLFTGQFLLLFLAFTHGMPPGLASVSQQIQAFFTVLLSGVFLRDIPGRRQIIGMVIAFVGLGLIASAVGTDLNFVGLGLAIAAAFSWAVGNVLVKHAPKVPMLSLVIWCSLVPPLPALLLSSVYDEHSTVEAVINASWPSIAAAVFYSGFLAIAVAYCAWGYLVQRYPAVSVAPFTLLTPCIGVVASKMIYGETFSPTRYAGMGLIMVGLAVIVLPLQRMKALIPIRWSR
ncbi:EamA family transporter [Bradyrhizobium sp. HKCCYLRH2057]